MEKRNRKKFLLSAQLDYFLFAEIKYETVTELNFENKRSRECVYVFVKERYIELEKVCVLMYVCVFVRTGIRKRERGGENFKKDCQRERERERESENNKKVVRRR